MSVNVPLRSRASLSRGVLAFRWAALAWMTAVALMSVPYRRPALAWAGIALAALWTLVVSRAKSRMLLAVSRPAFWPHGVDLLLAASLCLISGLVVPEGTVGARPFLATAYPAAAVLSWAVSGMRFGAIAGLVVGAAIVAARPLGGVDLASLSSPQAQTLANGVITYLLTGAAAGLVADQMARAADAVDRAVERQMVQTQRAARLAEREVLARRIHDSVLQALALVHKRGRELAAHARINPADVVALAELAGSQEQTLRSLIIRREEEAPLGSASLRDRLETVAASVSVAVDASATGPAIMPAHHVEEIAAAVRQALDNVVEHAFATRANVFIDDGEREVTVTVRDDGSGFALAEAEGFGLRSMQGRIEDLGGSFTITSAPGEGTEVEMVVPKADEDGS